MHDYEKTIKKLFVKFLIKEKILDSFIKNRKEAKFKMYLSCWESNLASDLFVHAFEWSKTKEHALFWAEKSKKWRNFLENFETKYIIQKCTY